MSRIATLLAAAFAAALVGCGDVKHEPVKVIATARSPQPAPAMPAEPLPAAAAPVPVAAASMPSPLPAAPTRAAAASVPALPGFDDRPPRFIQAGDPTGNDAFRRAFADRAASRPR